MGVRYYRSELPFAKLNMTDFRNKKAQLWLTNQRDALNPGHVSLKGIESDAIR